MSQNISIIEVGNYSEVYSTFINFIGTKTLIITDIDIYSLVDDVDKSGNPKKNKDGSIKQKPELCRVSEGKFTSNSSLKFYLKDQFNLKEGTEKDILTNLKFEEKIVSACEVCNKETSKKNHLESG